jgi:hypothetical protein
MAKALAADPAQSFQTRLRRLIGSLRPSSAAARRDVRPLVALCQTLLSERGEFSGRRLATDALLKFAVLNTADRETFFDHLVAPPTRIVPIPRPTP